MCDATDKAPDLDARGLKCPLPVIRLARIARAADPGTVLLALADDPAAEADIPAWAKASFAGTVVMDANDIGRNALGKDTAASAAVLEAAFADNPLGQGRERTPLAVVVRMD